MNFPFVQISLQEMKCESLEETDSKPRLPTFSWSDTSIPCLAAGKLEFSQSIDPRVISSRQSQNMDKWSGLNNFTLQITTLFSDSSVPSFSRWKAKDFPHQQKTVKGLCVFAVTLGWLFMFSCLVLRMFGSLTMTAFAFISTRITAIFCIWFHIRIQSSPSPYL